MWDLAAGQETDFIALDTYLSKFAAANNAMIASHDLGYADPLAEATAVRKEVIETLNGGSGVCARVKLQLDQSVVQTRDAFKAPLELTHAQPTDLTCIQVSLVIRDASGKIVNNLFGVGSPALDGIGAVDGTGTLSGGATGHTVWTIIPSLLASSTTPQHYTAGGTLTNVDNGQTVTVNLADVAITVYPQPELDLKYFWQRDVFRLRCKTNQETQRDGGRTGVDTADPAAVVSR